MQFLYLLEKIRVPGLNEIMLAVTTLGEETAFLALALIFFWCVDKRKGYLLMAVGFLGTIANQFMKLLFRVPRPWVLDENFTILEQAREAAGGYSFPSGHTQFAVGTFGSVCATTEKGWLKVICVTLAILVGFSRMYIGVHTPQDVLVAAAMAMILVLVLKKVIMEGGDSAMKILIAFLLMAALGLLAYVELCISPREVDAHNLESGMKNAYTMLGCLVGVAVVYLVDSKYLDFSTKAVWWAQILKTVLGLGVVILVKEVLRSPLDALFGGHMGGRAVRYFLIVIIAGILWPLTFRWFGKLGRKEAAK